MTTAPEDGRCAATATSGPTPMAKPARPSIGEPRAGAQRNDATACGVDRRMSLALGFAARGRGLASQPPLASQPGARP